jgi:hypothetical protein
MRTRPLKKSRYFNGFDIGALCPFLSPDLTFLFHFFFVGEKARIYARNVE